MACLAEGSLHLFTLFIPVWFSSFFAYPLLCRLHGASSEQGVDFYQEAYGPLNPPDQEGDDVPMHLPVHRRDPWYFTALGCLLVIVGSAGWAWFQGMDSSAYLSTFQLLIIVPTIIYFVAATLWMKNRRSPRSA